MKKTSFILFLATLVFSTLSAKPYKDIPNDCSVKILTPSLKQQKIGKMRLRNGVEVHIVSDPQAKQSAVALAMEVGSWDDPKEFQGIAHFAEHLVFMGSKKYPGEYAYQNLVSENGGQWNAFTANDATVFGFSSNHSAFSLVLDHFAHMLIAPLFASSSVNRELHAIHQEYALHADHDYWRVAFVEKAISNQNHPASRFNIGNLESLKNIPAKQVQKWWEQHYSGNKAHISVYSNLSLPKLKNMIANLFSALPTKSQKRVLPTSIPMSSQEQLGSIIVIEPFQKMHHLLLRWELPVSIASDLDHTAHHLVSAALESRHQGGLYNSLKTQNLIENVHAGIDRYSKEQAFFEIGFDLTPRGATEFESVITECYAALHMLKSASLPSYLFDELQTMATLNYAYQSQISPFQYVMSTAYQLTKEPLATFPQKLTIPTAFNQEQNATFLELLDPKSATYFLVAPTNLTHLELNQPPEKWYQVRYGVHEIPIEKLTEWQSSPTNTSLTMRKLNPLVPKELSLALPERKIKITPTPIVLESGPINTAYFWGDTHYRIPEVVWEFRVKSGAYNDSIKSATLGDLFIEAINDLFPTLFAYASPAGLGLDYEFNRLEFVFTLRGYNPHAAEMLTTVLDAFTAIELSDSQFNQIVQRLETKYNNFAKKPPYLQAYQISLDLLLNDCPRPSQKAKVLPSLTKEDFHKFSETFFEKTALKGMLVGNLTQKEAEKVWALAKNKLQQTPLPPSEQPQRKLLLFPEEKAPHKIAESTQSKGNATTLIVQWGPCCFETLAVASVLEVALKLDFFHTLRTKQQTGYVTIAKMQEIENHLALLLCVQSSSYLPEELMARFELFLENYVKELDSEISQERFQEMKTNVITLWEKLPVNLTEMFARLENFAFTHGGDFHYQQKKIQALKALTYKQFKACARKFLSRKENLKRVAILLTSSLPNKEAFRYTPVTASELKKYCSAMENGSNQRGT